jgi:hypothetical protein
VVEEGVTNELYHKVGKMDLECFAPSLVPDQTNLAELIENYLFEGFVHAKNKIRIELRELNVYGTHLIVLWYLDLAETKTTYPAEGSFTKPIIETSRREHVLGSLMIIFPTPHEGGSLLVWDGYQEWSFDPGRELTTAPTPTIGYVALFNDVEHEIAPITSGHRVTLTYDLCHEVIGPTPVKDPASGPFSLPVYERTFQETLEALLEDPEFLAYGGALGFGLRHVYPAGREIKHIYGLLKASDAVLYRSFRALGFQPALYLYYEWPKHAAHSAKGALIDHPVDFRNHAPDEVDIARAVLDEGGIVVCRGDSYKAGNDGGNDGNERPVKVDWVTPVTRFNRRENAYVSYGNEPSLELTYWDLCLIVRIGKAGERLMYPTVAQTKKESRR